MHLGTSVSSIQRQHGRLLACLADGTRLETDVVVFSAGVRPRDELARQAGLAVGPRGGIVVDDGCRTADPSVYAIGECACIGGRVYGLVGPGYAMAEVLADRLTGGSAAFTAADTSTKLKLMGVDVASFGDALAVSDGALEITLNDPVQRSYAKLVVSDDARVLLGGILVGDASKYAVLRPLTGRPLPGNPVTMIAPTSSGGAGSGSAGGGALPGTAQVCSRHSVTKDSVCAAITGHGLTDVPAIKAATRAGTGCGSCVPLLKTLLADSGVAVSRELCEHFGQTRAQLFDIVRVSGISTFTELIATHGRGRGCDICKPVAASILASLGHGHILDGEQAALQDTNDHFLANIQRNGSYSVVPRIAGGEITPEKLIVLGEVARDFSLYTKITGGQRIDLLGARVEQLPAIWQRLVAAGFESGHAYGKAVRTVKSCVGSTWCRYGVQDSVALAIELELRYRGIRSPHKIKAGVSGCARECAEARSKDIGVIAAENGWNLYVGGNGGFQPRHADLLLAGIDTATLIRTIDRFIVFYIRTADRLQRTASWLQALDGGLGFLRSVIVDDSLGIAAELDEAVARHVAGYEDEWAAVLADPGRLRRFGPEHLLHLRTRPAPPCLADRASAGGRSGTGSGPVTHGAAAPAASAAAEPEAAAGSWTLVCRYADLLPERGAAALIGPVQVALFRTFDGALYAIGNQDPFTGAFVLSRGIVGSRGDIPTVASPLHKQVFDLRTGTCLDDPAVSVPAYPVRASGAMVEVMAQ